MSSKSRKNLGNQRKNQRSDFSYTVIEFILHPDITYEIFIGFTLNISDSGLCMYTTKCLERGQEVIIRSSLPLLSKKASVRWTEKYDSFYYKVGLEFVK